MADYAVPRWLLVLAAVAILSGVFFRLYNIDRKVFWNDEVATAHLISGYASWEVEAAIADHPVGVGQLLSYQGPNPDRGLADMVRVVVDEDGGQSLIYYAVARYWAIFWQRWSNDIPAILRSLSAAASLAAFPLMWWLCKELSGSAKTSAITVALLAASPIFVLYAQEARTYSILVSVVLLSSASLLWALRTKHATPWITYGISSGLGLYLHMLFGFIIVGHGIYVISTKGPKPSKSVPHYLAASSAAFLAYLPWLLQMAAKSKTLFEVTAWTKESVGPLNMVAGWGCGVGNVFADANCGMYPLGVSFPIASAAVIFAAYAIIHFHRRASRDIRLFVYTLSASNILPLLLLDIATKGHMTSVPRYLLPSYLAVLICAAYLFAEKTTQRHWQLLFVAVLAAGIFSSALSSQSQTWWDKYDTKNMPETAAEAAKAPRPLIITDRPLSELWTISYLLEDNASILAANADQPPQIPEGCTPFAYKPSEKLRKNLQGRYFLEAVDANSDLWRLRLISP